MSKTYTNLDDVDRLTKMKSRFEDEVGTFFNLIDYEHTRRKQNGENGYTPFWSLIRMTFPFLESIGCLLYNSNSTENLKSVLKVDLSKIDKRYQTFECILPQLFRHPMTHTDELRAFKRKKTIIAWMLSVSGYPKHLSLSPSNDGKPIFWLNFNPKHFYEDILSLLDLLIKDAQNGRWNGELAKRYDKWKEAADVLNQAEMKSLSISAKQVKRIEGLMRRLRSISKI